MNDMDPFALNIRGATDLVENKTNKIPTRSGDSPEGISGEKVHALDLSMSDEELVKLKEEWEQKYAGYESKMKTVWDRNLESYLGKKKDGQWLNPEGPSAANIQFEAEETFLSAALSKNPEPVVWADNTPEGNAVATNLKTMLTFHADQLVLRRKFAFMVRQWSIYHLGVLKFGWNGEIGDVAVENRRIQNFVFDPEGYVDAYGDYIGFLGERIDVTAEKLIEMFPDCKEYIEQETDGKFGSKVTYTEWWSEDNTFTFKTYKKKVLEKNKNQYFNYGKPDINPLTGEVALDDSGEEFTIEGRNHFAVPKKPYVFLSVFSLQQQPHDITGLVEQNIANQKKVTDRSEQIDHNVSNSNNGYAYSEDNFDQETAKQAANARRKGNPILVPSGGPIERAIYPMPALPLPQAVFNEVEIAKNDLRQSWGINGISPQPHDEDATARGLIINQSNDTSRIGGGIGDAIEQVADNTFNWLVQLYYVFYDEKHFAVVMGSAKAVEYVTLQASDIDRQVIVSVSPDSLKPKDEVTQINLAQALFDKGAIGPKTLLKMLDFPDPDQAAADGILYKVDPASYMMLNFPEIAQQIQAQQQQAVEPQTAGSTAPEAITEPPPEVSQEPASAALSNVPLPGVQQGGAAL